MRAKALVGLVGALVVGTASAGTITVVNYGGAVADAMQTAFVTPYQNQTHNSVVTASYTGGLAKVKAMVNMHHVTWDAVEIESDDLLRGCNQGLYEHIDWSMITHRKQLEPAARSKCGVGIFKWATVLAYDHNSLNRTPTSWKDFWNVKKFPGKRGMRKTARGNLEFALMADGVPPSKVYKVLATKAGVNRAFKKMSQLRPYIVWWKAGAQPTQMLESGEVSMSTAFVGRIIKAEKSGQPLGISWRGALGAYDYWAIPKGTPNKKSVEQFINYTVSVQPQLKFISLLPTGPANRAALSHMSKTQLRITPNAPAHAKHGLETNAKFWQEHGGELDQRFASWVARQ